MKKLFAICSMMLLAMMAWATETVLRSEEFSCGDGWASGYVQINKGDLGELAAGDKVQVTVSAVSATDQWPCVYLQYVSAGWASWDDFADTEPHQVLLNATMELPYVAEFELSASMITKIQGGEALVVKGSGFTGSQIVLYHDDSLPTDTIWRGSVEMPASWGAWQQIGSAKFASVEEGDVLRFYAADVQSGAQGKICKADWKNLDDAPIQAFSGRYFQYTVTAAMLSEIQANGLIVSGCNYTLTCVRYIKVVDYQSAIVINQPDWTWTETTPSLAIRLTNTNAAEATVPVEVVVTTDKNVAVATYTENVTLAANVTDSAVFTLSDITAPGIYRFSAYVNEDIVSYTRPEDQAYTWTNLNIAYRPTEIVSAADAQNDFASFWQAAKAQLAAIPMNAKLTLVESGTYRDLYTVTLSSIPNGTSGTPVLIRGYYAEVKADGKYPCIVSYQGYDSDDSQSLWHPGADDRQDYNELIISARGQSFGNRGENKSDNIYCTTEETTENIANGKWFTWNFGNKDTYYYRGAYMDQVRGLDFVCSREKVDTLNIFCTGGSQGGAFTLIAAALSDGRVNAIAPSIQFMGDFPDYFKVGNWPVSEAEAARVKAGMTEAEMYTFLSYFDTKNFASMITAATISSIGLQDNVCPAHTNLAPFNLLTSEKQLYINKNLVHEVPNMNTWSVKNNSDRDWTALCNAWWTDHMKQAPVTGISNTSSEEVSTRKCFRDGKVIITRGEQSYTVLGTRL